MPTLWTVLLLGISNTFMTVAWYGHLKFTSVSLWKVILISWLIAFFEYCFQVPANRIGNAGGLSLGKLKVMQEAIAITVFVLYASLFTDTKLAWNYYAAFGCILLAVFFVFHEWT